MIDHIKPVADITITALRLLHPNLSIKLAVIASNIDTALVRAAKVTVRKKISPKTGPPTEPNESNTFGRATNISPGPALIPSVPINTYTAGMIIIPAKIAIEVSKISILSTALPKFTLRFMYEPYVTIMPIAIESE